MMQQRRFQQEIVDQIALKATEAEQNNHYPFTVVVNAFPGSGKTLSMLQSADALYKMGHIDTLVILVPRRNLAEQIERTWKTNRKHFEPGALGAITHRENKGLFIRRGESGYITTYQSLMADSERHHHELRDRRILLVLDEAHQLGVEGDDSDGLASTNSAEAVQQFVDSLDVVGILVMSGTPFRSDGNRLLYGQYTTHDDGLDYLKADVVATYSDGVEGGYLRMFQAFLFDGQIDLMVNGRDVERLMLSEYEAGLRRFLLEATGYWHGLVDQFLDQLGQRQSVDSRFRGLIACYNQEQATTVVDYLTKRRPKLRILKAISDDGDEAQQNLVRFQEESHDILVTVNMAYVGYDQPWIAVVLPLTGVRGTGYLRQLLARSLRVKDGIPYSKQPAIWVLPADPRMKEFIESERKELDLGLARRDRSLEFDLSGEMSSLPGNQQTWVLDGWLTEQSAMGYHREGDAEGREIQILAQLITDMKLDITVSGAKALFACFEQERQQGGTHAGGSTRTQRQQEKAALESLQNVISEVTHQVTFFRKACTSDRDSGSAHQAIRSYLKNTVGKAAAMLDLDEIEAEIALVRSWLNDNCVPEAVMAAFWRLS